MAVASKPDEIQSTICKVLLVGLLVLALVAISVAMHSQVRADYVPDVGSGPDYHFSVDQIPMTVVFVHQKGRRDFPTLRIPRAYVTFVNKAPASTKGPLPAYLETNQVRIAFTEPDGKAWSQAVLDQATEKRTDIIAAGTQLRPALYVLDLFPSTNPNAPNDLRRLTRSQYARSGDYEGLEVYRTDPGIIYYLGGLDDAFARTRCYEPINPASRCEFQFQITEKIWAGLRFADFRVHGGRAFANRGVHFARAIACRYLEQC